MRAPPIIESPNVLRFITIRIITDSLLVASVAFGSPNLPLNSLKSFVQSHWKNLKYG